MGTRGAWGFVRDGKFKVTYNHFDSYPEGLGVKVLNFLRTTTLKELHKIYDKIILVCDFGDASLNNNIVSSIPTKEQINECCNYLNKKVGLRAKESIITWYQLLRESQFKPEEYKTNLRYMRDGEDFLWDSVFCEFGYIIDLDKLKFNIHSCYGKNETKEKEENKHNIIPLVARYDLKRLPDEKVFLLDLKKKEEEEESE